MSTVLRIAHFAIGRCNPDSANGIDKTVYHLSRSQAQLGHRVLVCSLTNKPAIPIPGVDVHTYPPRTLLPFARSRLWRAILETRSPLGVPPDLVAGLLRWNPTVLHLHFVHVPQNLLLAHRASRRGIPYCVTINGGLSAVAQRRNRWVKVAFRVLFERRYLRDAAFLHAVSEHDVQGVRAYGVENRMTVVPNGIDLASVPAIRGNSDLRSRFPQLRKKRILLFLGRLDAQQKGLDLLVRGFAQAGARDTALVLAGPDWRGHRAALERTAAELGVSPDVYFTGPVFGDEKFALLADADVFAHPSRWEAGVPFSILEAAAMRKPCLFTPEADASGIMARYQVGVQVQPEISSVAAGIQQFALMGADRLRDQGERARSMVKIEFDWGPIAQQVVAAYRSYAVPASRR